MKSVKDCIRDAIEKCGYELCFLTYSCGPEGVEAEILDGSTWERTVCSDLGALLSETCLRAGRAIIVTRGCLDDPVVQMLEGGCSGIQIDMPVFYGLGDVWDSPGYPGNYGRGMDPVTGPEGVAYMFAEGIHGFYLRLEVLNVFDMGYMHLSDRFTDLAAEILGVHDGRWAESWSSDMFPTEIVYASCEGGHDGTATLDLGDLPLSSACRGLGLPFAEDIGYLEELLEAFPFKDPRHGAVETVLESVEEGFVTEGCVLYCPEVLDGMGRVRGRHIADLVSELRQNGVKVLHCNDSGILFADAGATAVRIVEEWSASCGIPVYWDSL